VTTSLPPARTPGQYAVALVCLGNICRSPMADVVLQDRLARAGLGDRVSVASCGTGDWHVGNRMDSRAATTLTAAGYDATRHRAQQLDPAWFDRFDLLLAMDAENHAELLRRAPDDQARAKVRYLREFDPESAARGDLDVPDPYYGGKRGFDDVLDLVEAACRGLLEELSERA
jgi:protein-tyrosine phosphatase